MNKLNLSNISKGIRTAVTKHSPEILTGIGITGMITTTIMAVRATPKALILIEERGNSLTPIETVKAAWTCYIPAAITGCLSIVCLIGASSVNVRRNAALAAAYTLSESALKEYQEKVVEHIGCHYAKIFPKSGIGGSEFPYVLAGMVESWGGECVDYPERRHCCGFGFRNYLVQANRGYSVANSKKKLESMAPYKPDFIVANCPGCAMFLDKWQYTVSEMEGTTYGQNGQGIPVLTYEEMAGLVLGYDPWDLGMQMHQVAVEPLLEKMGVPYDPSTKYLGKNGKFIGQPEPTAIGCYQK